MLSLVALVRQVSRKSQDLITVKDSIGRYSRIIQTTSQTTLNPGPYRYSGQRIRGIHDTFMAQAAESNAASRAWCWTGCIVDERRNHLNAGSRLRKAKGNSHLEVSIWILARSDLPWPP